MGERNTLWRSPGSLACGGEGAGMNRFGERDWESGCGYVTPESASRVSQASGQECGPQSRSLFAMESAEL